MGGEVKIAIIGAGRMAEHHILAFADIPDASISGIFSRTRTRAETLAQAYGIPKVYDSIDDLYAGTDADLVVIAVPELSVNTVCHVAFQYPWLALIEKPAGYNVVDAEAIAAYARKMGRRASVALNRRHYSSTLAVLQQVNEIDGQRLVNVFDQENPQVALEAGRPKLVVENWMYANSIHVIDYLRLFCRGDVTAVENIVRWNPTNPKFLVARVDFSSGDVGIYQAVWNAPGPWSVMVSTQAKRWEMRPLEQAVSQAHKSRENVSIEVDAWDIKFKPGLRRQAEEAVRAVRGEANSLPSLEDGLETMSLVSRIYAT
jgi:predicted dehydrogenase